MNDAMYEQLVARKPKPYDLLLRILIIFLIAATAIVGVMFLGFLSFFIAVVLAVLAYYFIFPRLSVEYEYILLNHDLQIDVIYNKEKRKHKLSIDIQGAEIIAPKNSHRLGSHKPEKTLDFSSGNPDAKTYAIFISLNQTNTCIYIDPDEKMVNQMKQWMGMKMFTD